MTREELIRLISTSKINERLMQLTVSQLQRKSKEELQEIYNTLCKEELNEILNGEF